MEYLKVYNKQDVLSLTKIRRFETKLGERIQVIQNPNNLHESLENSKVKYVIVGVPEDIGVKANWGIGGTETAWLPFLQSFLNIQSNDFLQGDEMILLGHLDFSDITNLIENSAQNDEEKVDAYRHAVNTVDEAVEEIVKIITQHRKLPIIIGGGQNNAYPCIKGAAKGWHKSGVIPLAQINAINVDAHTDYRPSEGRHSGNAFRYAEEDGYLEKYCVVGIHENYLQQNVWLDIVNNPFIDCITYEDIFLHEKKSFIQAIGHATDFTDDTLCGIELDMDSIEYALSSAGSSVGITPLHARQYLHYVAFDSQPAYLHICEGASSLNTGQNEQTTGKLISYLISDFVKAMQKTN
jgi:formiminoglutamase